MSRAYRTATDWQALISQWESSTLSAPTFCEQHGIGYASFCQWRKRLKATADTAVPTDATAIATFIDLGALAASSPTNLGQSWHIVLSLGNGVELRLSQG